MSSEQYGESVLEIVQRAQNFVERWYGKKDLSVNPAKKTFVPFARKKQPFGMRELYLYGSPLEVGEKVQYLGMILDLQTSSRKHNKQSYKSPLGM